MTKKTITIEAESLEKAKEQVKSQIPAGYFVFAEEVVSDEGIKAVTVTAKTIEEAKQMAMNQIPDGVKILSTKEVVLPEQMTFSIEAYDEAEAKKKLHGEKGRLAVVQRLQLLTFIKIG